MKLIRNSLTKIIECAPFSHLKRINGSSGIRLIKTIKFQYMSEKSPIIAEQNLEEKSSKVGKIHRYGVALDIDGTITVSTKILPGAKQGLEKIISLNIPFILLTNNTSKSEQVKANELNKILNLSKPITAKQVVLNYTPVKHKLQNLSHGIVLIVGRKNRLQNILPLPFIEQYITVDEYIALFPESVPLSNRANNILNLKQIEQLKERLKINEVNKHNIKISGIFLMTTPTNWEESYQVIIDHLSSEDGSLTKNQYFQHIDNHIPVIAAFADKTHFSQEHNLPRILMGPFIEGLKAVYKLIYHQDLSIQVFGKPQLFVYEFTKKQLQKSYGQIDKMIMIGDNQHSDIIGAYNAGWDSILVRSGVTYHESKIATVNANDIFEGLEKYFQLQQSK